jgi:transcriptional regulator
MYVPKHFEIADRAVLDDFVERHGFATLVSDVDGAPFATHLPLVLDRSQPPRGTLLGHVARANPHWQAFDGKREALAIFHGPHAYVSPSAYLTSPAVPTWNYAVVHAYGIARVVEDDAWVGALVDRLIRTYEAGRAQPWPGVLPPEFKQKQLRAIVGFEMAITRVEGKFKLNQNRSLEDQRGVVRDLESSAYAEERALGELMKRRMGDRAAPHTKGAP